MPFCPNTCYYSYISLKSNCDRIPWAYVQCTRYEYRDSNQMIHFPFPWMDIDGRRNLSSWRIFIRNLCSIYSKVDQNIQSLHYYVVLIPLCITSYFLIHFFHIFEYLYIFSHLLNQWYIHFIKFLWFLVVYLSVGFTLK